MNDKLKAAEAAKRTQVFGIISGALIALYGLWISRSHITEIGYWMHLRPSEAETLFVFVDFIAIYGKVLTHKRLTAKTRRIGYKLLAIGGVASLACNIGAGFITNNIGESAYGAAIVGIIAMLEYAIANTKAKAIRIEQKGAAAPARAKTNSGNKGKAWSPARRAAFEASKAAAVAPVSPGLGPVGTYAGRKA